MGKSLRNKYGQKLLDSAKNFTTDAIKTASKRAIEKLLNKITSVSKKPSNNNNNDNNNGVELKTHKKDIYLQKKDSKLLMN